MSQIKFKGLATGCCPDCENSVKILKSGGAAYAGATVHVYEWDVPNNAPGPLVFAGTTDAAGIVVTDLPYAFYQVRVRPGETDEIRKIVLLNCGEVETVKYSNRTVNFTVHGCYNYLPGAVVTIHRGDGGEFVTAATFIGPSAKWLPQEEGPYTYTISHPSGRFQDATGSGTVPAEGLSGWSTTHTHTLAPKAGYMCCSLALNTPQSEGQDIPFGPLLVTTSAGDSWYWTHVPARSCTGAKCTVTDAIPVGSPPVSKGVAGTSCIYFDWPADLATAQTPCQVSFSVSPPGYSGKWVCQVRGLVSHTAKRFDPITAANCSGSIPTATRRAKNWWSPGDCNNTSLAVEAVGVVNSSYPGPLSITFTFPTAGTAWEWTDTPAAPESKTVPPPLASVTITEML